MLPPDKSQLVAFLSPVLHPCAPHVSFIIMYVEHGEHGLNIPLHIVSLSFNTSVTEQLGLPRGHYVNYTDLAVLLKTEQKLSTRVHLKKTWDLSED